MKRLGRIARLELLSVVYVHRLSLSVFHDLVDTGVKHLLNFISLKSNGKLKFHSGSVNSMKKNFVLVYVVYQQFNKP